MHTWQWAIGILVLLIVAELGAFWRMDRTASGRRFNFHSVFQLMKKLLILAALILTLYTTEEQ